MRISDWSSDVCSSDLYSPMVDGWIGDDWFSYGAFRQVMFPYFIGQITRRGRGSPIASQGYDDYATLLRAGSASAYAKRSEERRVGKECVSTGRSRWSASY